MNQLVQDETEADQTSPEAKRANPEAEETNSATEESPDEEQMFMDRGDGLEGGLSEIDTVSLVLPAFGLLHLQH